MTRFILDSGDPKEYQEIAALAKEKGSELWGGTTNPTLIAKNLGIGKKYTQKEAFDLQKSIVFDILKIVPGAVSAEVYADEKTTAQQMIEQGIEIAKWHQRVVIKLPTTIEGFKARTQLRKDKISINNTLVFSQEQIFTICLHENIIKKVFGFIEEPYAPFISPFVGRLDDLSIDGMQLVENGMKIKALFDTQVWMLEASVRTLQHIKRGIYANVELITAPAKVYREWFALTDEQKTNLNTKTTNLRPIPYWQPHKLLGIRTIDDLMDAITTGKLNIHHDLTDKGLVKFAADWNAILS
ncbi:MAG: hypothetical protein HYT11_03175 [Candidatus Levybacteria bacterium]|nr:hypothetical protein [Candidatus Levybacteria bacterium]